MHEHGLTDVAVVERTVVERLHIAVARAHNGRHIASTIQEAIFGRVLPHLQEHLGHVGDTRTHQTDTGVLPVAKAYALIDILIGQVDAAHKDNVTVHDADFTVVTVVEIGVQGGNEAVKTHGVDAQRAQVFVIAVRERAEAARVVIHDAHFTAFPDLAY